MLIRFVVANFRSFKDETEFNLLPGKSEEHRAHLLTQKPMALLPLGVIYGANAAGKTNLLYAIDFARNLIVKGTDTKDEPFQFTPFRLDTQSADQPSRFEFEFIIDDQAYAYGMVLNEREILEEWLFKIGRDGETRLFERKKKVFTFWESINHEDHSFLKNEGRGTRSNQLFLCECARREVPFFDNARRWFEEKLSILFSKDIFGKTEQLLESDQAFKGFLRKALSIADFGIENIESEPAVLPTDLMTRLKKDFKKRPNTHGIILTGPKGERINVFRAANGQISAKRLITQHRSAQGEQPFFYEDESAGTQRYMDLAPKLMQLFKPGHVLFIDEFELSLHTSLCLALLRSFLEELPKGKGSQLIFTTHDVNLLDLDILRTDEIWLTQKDEVGRSTLFSLSDFKRFPREIRTGYLTGRFGAIPLINDKVQLREVDDGARLPWLQTSGSITRT